MILIKTNYKKAFTLIEIVVVMVLLGFLMSITMGIFNSVDSVKERSLVETGINDVAKAVNEYIKDTKRRPLDIAALINEDSIGCNDVGDSDIAWNGPYLSNESLRLNRVAYGDGQPVGFGQATKCDDYKTNSTYAIMGGAGVMDLTNPGAITQAMFDNINNYLALPQELDPKLQVKIFVTKATGLNYYGNKCMVGVMAAVSQNSAGTENSKAKILLSLKSNRDIRETDWDIFTDTTDGYYYADFVNLGKANTVNYLFIPVAETDCL